MVRSAAVLGALALLVTAGSAGAAPTPVVGKNVELVGQLPEAAGAIAMRFSVDKPLMVLSTMKGIHTYDVSTPAAPVRVGYLPMVIEQNEGMSLVERPNGTKFALIGSNGAVAGVRENTLDTATDNKKLFVVDVTNPAAPKLISSVVTPTRTHTVSCATTSCEFAYSDGRVGGAISIIDLRDPWAPKAVTTFQSVVPNGHDQDVDAAGVFWHVGVQGSVALDVSDPVNPVQLNSTTADGLPTKDYTGKPYNNFIHHNSARPNAAAFAQEPGPDGRLTSGPPSLARGNVLLVTEEDYVNTTATGAGRCGDYEGSFQTWHVPFLDAGEYAEVNPDVKSGQGTIAPLDRWNTELLDQGTTPAGAFCSAHYFDERDGFVAQGWYQQGTRILDVRDPTDIKQVGYFFTGAMETWAAYWVPARLTGGRSIVYTADAARGVDVLEVRLPETAPKRTRAVRAPVLRSWLRPVAGLRARASADWGFLCPLPRAL